MKTFNLTTEPRTDFGSTNAGKLRNSGRYPATLVGGGQPTVQFSVSAHAFDACVRNNARKFSLELEGAEHPVAISEVQWDRMGDKVMQIDFVRDPEGELAEARARHFGDKGYEPEED